MGCADGGVFLSPPNVRRPGAPSGGWDEDDVRTRPGKSSRPRTRDRPGHHDAVSALVIGVDRGRWTVRLPDGTVLVAVRGGELRRVPVVVGDNVDVVGDVSGTVDTLGRIVRVAERTSVLRRTPDDVEAAEKPVVANAELLVAVIALADPPPRPRLIDRLLVAAYDGGLTPVLCLTKRDLASDAALRADYDALGFPVVTLSFDGPLDALLDVIGGRTSVFFGHSGVGKSTLVNRLVPGTGRAVGHVNDVTGRGRHTSSSAVLLDLPAGGWVIDTPGVRSFGLGLVSVARVLAAFPEVAEVAEECQPGCDHVTTPDCALDLAVAEGTLEAPRVAALRRILTSREGDDEPERLTDTRE